MAAKNTMSERRRDVRDVGFITYITKLNLFKKYNYINSNGLWGNNILSAGLWGNSILGAKLISINYIGD